MGFDRGHFFSALAGLIVGVMVIAMLPAGAANGDPAIVGAKNTSLNSTKFVSRNSTQLQNTKAGRPALRLIVRDGAPPMAVGRGRRRAVVVRGSGGAGECCSG